MNRASRRREIRDLLEEGRKAALKGKSRQSNPHRYCDEIHWYHGYDEIMLDMTIERESFDPEFKG